MSETASQTHLGATGAPQVECGMSGCGVLFKRTRRWQMFCSGNCRNAYHAREARIEAIRARAVVMYECLADFAEQGNRAAAEAIEGLKAP